MAIYKTPVAEFRFLLDEVLDYTNNIASLKEFADYDLETIVTMIAESGKFCANELLPINAPNDAEGLKYDPVAKTVTTPKGLKECYKKFRDQGLVGIIQPTEFGGGGAPHLFGALLGELQVSTNTAFSMLPGLSQGAMNALVTYGSDELKKTYMPNLVSGEWSGTMCLTEPQCGTDLGLCSTKAEACGDHWKLTGTKIWISFGEHDCTSNIVHLVLARLPDAPEGIKGISLFLVPKFLPSGERNGVFCGGLEHKMGIHASPTCVINFEGAEGWLVGTPHKGMQAMFVMMNAARLEVGIQGLGMSEVAYQNALSFAKERRQSRSLDRKKQDPNAPADVILVHPDVRRMLLNVRASTEGMRALAYWTGLQIDLSHHHPDEAARADAADMVALFTPIVKSYLTERGFENVSEALQVLGGSGYTRDWGLEQMLRDTRISMIYEGTNHIQALDLVGRKLPVDNGRMARSFGAKVQAFIEENASNEAMKEFIAPLTKTAEMLGEMSMELVMKAMSDPEEAGARASNYLNLFALTAIAWLWARMAKASLGKDDAFHKTKLKTARYFFSNVLPETRTLVAFLKAGKTNMMAFDADEF
ncbi:MAG: acyl-CoA dehydrogenase C-terminal domain-containing protein [Verrucomicrobia bacterium]|nr:acyl-CoA dehydrogenase C-terminal domain-containing protein [Verrucomicrobiota bacterium]